MSETNPLPNEDTFTKVLPLQNSHPSSIKLPPSAVPIMITGSSIIRDLLPGTMNYNGKLCNIKIRTKGGALINHISNLVKTNRIDKQFTDSEHVIISTGSVDIKHTTPESAIQNIRSLIRTFKEKLPDASLALCTLPYQYDPSLKPSLQQQLNKDIEDFNTKLIALDKEDQVQIIAIKFTQEHIDTRDGIHLNGLGTKLLSSSINNYLSKCI
ncbi:unnamed protein product [Didymodactylos carnosus]|uniref:SGNH hydrolase-type esterase domain-containing protein n=1 Tax=Didymodactylos carnosus TaxID=1234261 RepID=A0A8S2FJV5_9BILA|nr:unnamed protein product [Didymodactylos carnosus]CAF4266467.1 unnamed protein product [Didymodactylos carnosus]